MVWVGLLNWQASSTKRCRKCRSVTFHRNARGLISRVSEYSPKEANQIKCYLCCAAGESGQLSSRCGGAVASYGFIDRLKVICCLFVWHTVGVPIVSLMPRQWAMIPCDGQPSANGFGRGHLWCIGRISTHPTLVTVPKHSHDKCFANKAANAR